MAKHDDGGPAFPFTIALEPGSNHPDGSRVPLGTREMVYNSGMSLRDYFAGQAIAGVLASEGEESEYPPAMAAHRAYTIADAMLTERAKLAAAEPADSYGPALPDGTFEPDVSDADALRLRDDRAETLLAAINYATNDEKTHFDALSWLKAWSEGDPDAMRELNEHRAAEAPPHGEDR